MRPPNLRSPHFCQRVPGLYHAHTTGNAALASGALVRMYPDTRILRESSLSLLYPGHRLLPMKARVFIDFLKDICSRRQGEIPMVVSSS